MNRAHAAVALLVGASFGALAAQDPVHDPDLFWHLATAREAVAHGLVRTDVFSWTVPGSAVTVDQWLGQLLLYFAYLVGDWRGIVALRAIEVAALIALMVANALLARSDRPLLGVLATLPAVFLTRFVWVDRPELIGFVAFAVLLVLLRLGRSGSSRALFAVVPLIALWANLHGSFAVGVVVAIAVCLEGVWHDRARGRVYVLVACGVALASLVTPAGVSVWTTPGSHFLSPVRDVMEEGVIDVRTPIGALYAMTLALVLLCALVGRASSFDEIVLILPVAFLSLTALRHAPFLAIAAAPLFANRIGAVATWAGLGRRDPRAPSLEMTVAALAMGLLIVSIAFAPARVDESAYPVGALPSLPAGGGTFNTYDWGGWLIWRAPTTTVFIDGRLTPYLGPTLQDYRIVVAATPGWRDVIARRGIRALLVRPTDPVAVRALELGWRPLAASERFVLLVPR